MTGPAVRVAAQAKLNLHLRVLAREESGFHSLETVFHRIDLADDIVVEVTEGERTIDVAGADAGPPESNLALRAAQAYASQTGWPLGFRILLDKRIPTGAGLGGGSADAAAVLRALDSMSPNPIGSHALMLIASSLGSDVPFLASEAVMALAWSRGERMLALSPLPQYDLLLMAPDFSVSTSDAYRWLDEDRAATVDDASHVELDPIAIGPLELSSWTAVGKFARNDFEGPVAKRHPALAGYLERLRSSRAVFAQMTGSGSTIFGVLDSPPNYSRIPDEHRGRVTTTRTSIDVVQPIRVG
ncbi:MAG: 4-(cytidine 5'-diphospho)-2-C-methyl-D-erythritol kinase [Gemmatimonadales bacterium]